MKRRPATNPRLNYPPSSPAIFTQQSAAVRFRQSEWRKKLLLLRTSSRIETIVPTRKYVLRPLSFLLPVPFPFRRFSQKVDVVSRFIPFIADNFVRLASPATVFPNGRSSIRRLPYEKKRGERLFLLLPPLPSCDRKPSSRSIESRTRSSYFCIHVVQFHEISRSLVHLLVVARFVRCLLIAFHFVNFFFLRRRRRKIL